MCKEFLIFFKKSFFQSIEGNRFFLKYNIVENLSVRITVWSSKVHVSYVILEF
jgi:hypothetical protein